MAALDDFLRAQVSTGLWPGEEVLGFAHLRCPTRFNAFGVPQFYVHWLAAATSARLVLFLTDADGMFGDEPRREARESHAWSYEDLARVDVGDIEGLNVHSGGQGKWVRLVPHPYCGPMPGEDSRYDIYPAAKHLDDQRRFLGWFPQWLQQRVAAGAFPMAPERRAAIEARIASERAAQAERARQQEASIRRALPMVVAIVLFLLALGTGALCAATIDTYLDAAEENDDERGTTALVYAALSGLASLALIGAGVVALRSKRIRQVLTGTPALPAK